MAEPSTRNWYEDLQSEVHLYFARPEVLSQDPRALAVLDEEELIRYHRFLFAHSKIEFCAAHALVRTVLSRYFASTAPSAWKFEANPWGRPVLAAQHRCDDFHFNLSHTTGLVVLAVTRGRELGVDVEYTLRTGQTVEIANRFFAPSEVQALHALPSAQQRTRFFSYWTLKESYIKARGMGLAIPLDQFAFGIDGDEQNPSEFPGVLNTRVSLRCEPSINDDSGRWSFSQFALSEGHRAALALSTSTAARVVLIPVSTLELSSHQ